MALVGLEGLDSPSAPATSPLAGTPPASHSPRPTQLSKPDPQPMSYTPTSRVRASISVAGNTASLHLLARSRRGHRDRHGRDAGDGIGSAISVELTLLAADAPSYTPDAPPGPLMKRRWPPSKPPKRASGGCRTRRSNNPRGPNQCRPHSRRPSPARPPARAALSPSPGSAASPAKLQITWNKALVAHLNRFKRYPNAARTRGVQGEVSVTFTIDRTGQVVASHVLRSSGSTTLDDEALAVLHRASPLPSPPAQVAGATIDLTIPIQFKIRWQVHRIHRRPRLSLKEP